MERRTLLRLAAAAMTDRRSRAQEPYSGPKPPKPDIPYLLQANRLIETEVTEAREEDRKDGQVFVIAGAASPVKTPMAEPIFLFQASKIQPGALQLFRLEVNGSNREVTLAGGKKRKNVARPLRLDIKQIDSALYRVEAYETLDPGEYSLSPSDSNAAFCFAVY